MNRFAAAGLIAEAEQGRRVLVVSASWPLAHHAFLDFEPLAANASRISRVAGNQRIDFAAGGSIRFTSALSQPPGVEADLVFVDWDAEVADPSITQRYVPCLATSLRGELVHA